MSANRSIDPFASFQLGPVAPRNCFIRAGANEGMCVARAPSKALVKHHRDMAAGGVGLTTVACGAVSEVGRTLSNQIWIRPEVLPDLEVLANAVHDEGGRVSFQLTHGASFVTSCRVAGPTMCASSGVNKAGVLRGKYWQRAMNEVDTTRVASEFVAAAEICRNAGFDAVEIHMGHSYLLNQFISPLSDKRKDAWGGSAEYRARCPVEDAILTARARALQAAGADMLVLPGGRNIESGWFMFGSNSHMDKMKKVLPGSSPLTSAMLKLAQPGAPKVSQRTGAQPGSGGRLSRVAFTLLLARRTASQHVPTDSSVLDRPGSRGLSWKYPATCEWWCRGGYGGKMVEVVLPGRQKRQSSPTPRLG